MRITRRSLGQAGKAALMGGLAAAVAGSMVVPAPGIWQAPGNGSAGSMAQAQAETADSSTGEAISQTVIVVNRGPDSKVTTRYKLSGEAKVLRRAGNKLKVSIKWTCSYRKLSGGIRGDVMFAPKLTLCPDRADGRLVAMQPARKEEAELRDSVDKWVVFKSRSVKGYDASIGEDTYVHTYDLSETRKARISLELSVDSYATNSSGKYVRTSSSTTELDLKMRLPAAEYSVTYDANGGTGTVADTKVVLGKRPRAASADALSREGYRFSGWNTAADGTGTSYSPGDRVDAQGNVTLYAQWSKEAEKSEDPATWTVSFDSAGGSSVASRTIATTGSSATVTLPDAPTRSGYSFKGWKSASGATYAAARPRL